MEHLPLLSYEAFLAQMDDATVSEAKMHGYLARYAELAARIAEDSDEVTKGYRDPSQEQIVLPTKGWIQVISDFDGTITYSNGPKQDVSGYLAQVPGMSTLWKMEKKRIESSLAYAATVAQGLKHHSDKVHAAGVAAKEYLRPGVEEYMDFFLSGQAGLTICTTSYEPMIKGALEDFSAPYEFIGCTADSLSACLKHAMIQRRYNDNPGVRRFYVGDGSSDVPVVTNGAWRYLEHIFAARGEKFEAALLGAGISYTPYDTLDEVVRNIQTRL